IFGIAAIITAVYAGATMLARSRFRLNVGLVELRDVATLLGAGLLGALLATFALSIMLSFEPDIVWSDMIVALVPLLVGDSIGIAVVTPLVLRILHKHPLPELTGGLVLEIAIYLALIFGALFIIAAM